MGIIYKNGNIYSGSNTVALTQADYDALSQAEKENGTIYFVTDGIPTNKFLKTTTIQVLLQAQTWTASGGGKYYITYADGISISGATQILSTQLVDFAGLRTTDMIQAYGSKKLQLISNVNSFYNIGAYVTYRVTYI